MDQNQALSIAEKAFFKVSEAKQRTIAIVELPYQFRERAVSNAKSWYLKVARPRDEETLQIFMHELGHLATLTPQIQRSASTLQIEWMATYWAAQNIKSLGGHITPTMDHNFRQALATYYRHEGLQPDLDPKAVKFLTGQPISELITG